MTHIWVGNQSTIGSDNGLSLGRRQAIMWTKVGILLIRPLETKLHWNFIRNSNKIIQEIYIYIYIFETVAYEITAIFVSSSMC